MSTGPTPLTRFFETWQRANDAGAANVAALFADTFLVAGPEGARAVPGAAFAPALEQRKELFARLGARPAELVSLEEISLDSRYALARTRWRMAFRRAGGPDVEFVVESTFLVDLQAERILVYLAHEDIFAILRERGMLVEQAAG